MLFRSVLQARLSSMDGETTVVVRALEGSVDMSSEELGRSLDRLLALAFKKMPADADVHRRSGGVTAAGHAVPRSGGNS